MRGVISDGNGANRFRSCLFLNNVDPAKCQKRDQKIDPDQEDLEENKYDIRHLAFNTILYY